MYKYRKLTAMTYPAPVIDLIAIVPDRPALMAQSQGLLDTGANITCVPKSIIDELKTRTKALIANNVTRVKGAIGTEKREVYVLDLRLGNCYFPNVHVLALPGMDYALIGRDILNDYMMTFDAPNNSWSIAANCT